MITPGALAFAAGFFAALAAAQITASAAPCAGGRAALALERLSALWELLARPSSEGREPGAAERRRLLVAAAAVALLGGTLVAGPGAGVLVAAVAPTVVGRTLHARRERYRRAVARGAGQIAIALADALGGGHSVRGAIVAAAPGVAGPPGHELRRAASELALGARTEDALEAMRDRVRSHEIDALVAGVLLQRRAGGDLASLLRESARAFEDQSRLVGEVRAATAQARFTGLIVVLLPLGGGVLAELASPGFLLGLADGLLTAWLVGLALVMQAVAAVLIRGLGRVRE